MRALCLFLTVAVLSATAQNRSAFEVATVRLHPNGEHEGGALQPSRIGVTAANMSLKQLVAWAWNIRPDLIFGPAWIDTLHYDISAKAADESSLEQKRLMLQALLEERVHLTYHRETKVLPVYALVVNKSGTKHMTKAAPDSQRGETPGIAPGGEQIWTFKNIPMSVFVGFLQRPALDRSVIDMTGLTDGFDFAFSLPAMDPDISQLDYIVSDMFPAVSSQLGMSVVPRTAPLEVLAVDKADKTPLDN